jgi:hypothetical protein
MLFVTPGCRLHAKEAKKRVKRSKNGETRLLLRRIKLDEKFLRGEDRKKTWPGVVVDGPA